MLTMFFFRNIRLVDAGVRDSFRLLENYWGHDGRTSYIFTADHGMTDWGSHGAGSAHETETPILVWGAGLRPPQSAPHRCFGPTESTPRYLRVYFLP